MSGMQPKRAAWRRSFARGIQPPPNWTVDQWADRRRRLSTESAASPGPWNTDLAPYQREIMEVLSADHPAESVALMAGAQLGKTEVMLNWVGYCIDLRPAPMMMVLPNKEIARDFSDQRISSLVEETPTIKEKMGSRRGRKASNTKLNKAFPGGMLLLRGANSAAGLRSTPVQYLAMDEVDGFVEDVEGEGDPVMLAWARTRTFARRKIFLSSTPTIKGQSRIEAAFEETDQRRYHVPCPHCDHSQVLNFRRLRYDKEDPRGTVHYRCEECEGRIKEGVKSWWYEAGNARGRWIPTAKGVPGKVGFHISSLYAPQGWYSWGDIVEEFEKAKSNPRRLRVFVNTVLGETWEVKGSQPNWEIIFGRREHYPQWAVPEKALVLTAGVDVQQDRLEVEVVGWGPGLESWSVGYEVIVGRPNERATWAQLDEILNRRYPHELGEYIKISCMAVDSGYSTQDVYRYCRQHSPRRVMAVQGKDNLVGAIGAPRSVDMTIGGRRVKDGATVRYVGTNNLKDELYGWLLRSLPEEDEEYPPGWCHFPEYNREYFKQLCAEKMVVKTVRNRVDYAWEKTRPRNEALDCRIYARAAAVAVGVDYYTEEKWAQLRDQMTLKAPKPTRQTAASTGGGWLDDVGDDWL